MEEEGIVEMLGFIPAVALLVLLLGFTFFLLAIVCDEALAPTLEELSDNWKIPHDVACATFLALGSSAPEIAISVVSVMHGKKTSVDLSLGTLMGSALIAYTIIPAVCIWVSPGRELKLNIVPLFRDVAFFCFGMLCVISFAKDGSINVWESLLLVSLFFLYLVAMKVLSPFYEHEDEPHHFLAQQNSNGNGNYGTLDEETSTEKQVKEDEEDVQSHNGFAHYVRNVLPPFNLSENDKKAKFLIILMVSIFYVSILSELCLFLAEVLSDVVGISSHFTGLVLVALGAQVPDTVASMAVARHGEGPSSIANAVGSQVLNINIGVGLPFLISNIVRGYAIPIAPSDNSGSLVFGTVLLFLTLILSSNMTLRLPHACILMAAYGLVIFVFGAKAHLF